MAEEGVRKSSRIKSRGPMAYAEDDLDLAYDLHLDISNEIFGGRKPSAKQKSSSKSSAKKNGPTTVTSSQQKNKGKFDSGRRQSTSNLSKKVEKMSDSGGQKAKTSSENYIFKVAKMRLGGDNSTNTIVDGNNFPCSVCDNIFGSKKEMQDHMAEIHGDEVMLKGYLICEICNQMCINQSVYDKHMKLHSDCRKFRCEICQKAFSDSCSLKRHMKSHDDERPYTCDLCMKSFRDNPSLSRHQRTHTDRPRMYNCLKCDKDFTDKHTLKRHERTHMDIRPFECETCSKTFSEPGSFRRHLKIHSGVRNFMCPVCSRSFLEKQSLIRHQKNVCGFGVGDQTSLPSFFNNDQDNDGRDSDTNDSDVSPAAVDEKVGVLNENTSTDDYLSTSKSRFSDVNEHMLPVNSKKCELSEKSNGFGEPKDAPSLRSLIQKNPELYDSISEIVESITSYEKMLDLCGDTGQVAIDAALTREPAPMPDNLLCFECGEQLVDGENFRVQGKSFHPSLCNSYKCLNCEDVEDYGEPPVLTAEMPATGSTLPENCYDKNTADEMMQTKQKKKLAPSKDSMNKNLFGTNESLEILRESLKSQQGMSVFGHLNNSYVDSNDEEVEESDGNDQTDITGSVATSSRSHSFDSEATHIFVGSQDGINNPDLNRSLAASTSSFGSRQQDHLLRNSPGRSAAAQETQQGSLSMTPKLDYEADDQSIPSVFPCHLCTKVFASSAFLTRHLNLHKISPHKCMVCSKTFTNSQNLKRHITTHTGEKPYTCPYCRKRFRDPSNFSKHKRACCALQPAASPADCVKSLSYVSSPHCFDDSGSVSHFGAHVTDLKQNVTFPSCSAPTESSVSQDLPVKFAYDNDEEEDLPVSFGHPPDDSDVLPTTKYPLDTSSESVVKNEVFEGAEGLTGSNTRIQADEDSVLIPCAVCGKVFESEHLLEIHMKYHTSDPRVTCIECGKCFADPFGLKRHLRIHAGIRPHVCEYCGRGYCDNWSLRKHKSRGCMLQEVKVPADFLHPCLQCTRVFSESEFLDEHMKCHNGLLRFECDICQKGFSEAFNLKRHRRLHMAVCTSCDKEFQDVNSLNEHLANECSLNTPQSVACKETGFPCEECGRVYTTKSYLERHKKFHLDLKTYVCEICSKRFSEAFRLQRHLKIHKGERPFSCETCLKQFTDFSSLKRHLSNSSCSSNKEVQDLQESEHFSCDLCDKFFTKNYLLARHMNVHSKERPFTCDECGRTYKDTSSLRRHQLIHQGIKSFICPVCSKDFFYSDSLKRHLISSCGKKTNPRHRRRGRGKGKRKSNNNINMKDRNTVGKNTTGLQEKEAERFSSSSQRQLLGNKLTVQVLGSSQDMKLGLWSCQRNNHCWRCSLKFATAKYFFKHCCLHRHKKPFRCRDCFFRSSRKVYLKLHRRTHKSELTECEETGNQH